MEDEDEVVAKFCGVTTATPEQAKFYLESTEWHLEPALQLFFESDGGVQGQATPMNFADYDLTEDENMGVSESEILAPENRNILEASTLSSTWDPVVPAVASIPAPEPPQRIGSFGYGPSRSKGKEKGTGKKSATSRGLVTTLGDLGKQSDSDSDSEGQEYYAGGEKSGMVVQDPNKKHGRRDVEAIFERVRKLGAQEGPAAEPTRPAAPGRNSFFSGSSRTISGETRQQDQPVTASAEQPALQTSPEPIFHDIHFWRNGFTVSGGPLRSIDDPANVPFLESINRSECPRELEPTDRSIPVHVNLVKRITEDWQKPPEPKYVPFKGAGHTLGTLKPAASSDTVTPPNPTDAPRPSQGLIIDEAKPATSLQLRLLDGTRMVARFNNDHTVADIRGFIDAARPGSSGIYQLQTVGFPPVKLTNPTQTIEGAGLLNAVVIQKS